MRLQLYVDGACGACGHARIIAARVRQEYPEVDVEVVEAGEGEPPPAAPAVPAYFLEGRLISLGNPTFEDLARRLGAALEREEGKWSSGV